MSLFRLSGIKEFLILLTVLEFTVAEITPAELYSSDTCPTVATIAKFSSKNGKSSCAIKCVKDKSCNSFAFYLNGCLLWDAKYIAEDQSQTKKMMETMESCTYYHVNRKLGATEIKLISVAATFDQAFQECQKLKKGSLIAIHDQKTLDKFNDLVGNNKVWIGMNGTVTGSGGSPMKRASSFDLRWVDGHVFTWGRINNFDEVNPNTNGKACIATGIKLPQDRNWIDTSCDNAKPYVCQYAP